MLGILELLFTKLLCFYKVNYNLRACIYLNLMFTPKEVIIKFLKSINNSKAFSIIKMAIKLYFK
jgi:hypothetical protein